MPEENKRQSGRIKVAPLPEEVPIINYEKKEGSELHFDYDKPIESSKKEKQVTTNFMENELMILQQKIAGLEQKLSKSGVENTNLGFQYNQAQISSNLSNNLSREDSRFDINLEKFEKQNQENIRMKKLGVQAENPSEPT